jgi:hypothetical protein
VETREQKAGENYNKKIIGKRHVYELQVAVHCKALKRKLNEILRVEIDVTGSIQNAQPCASLMPAACC